MKITAINQQVRDQNRVNVLIDGVFICSLDIAQVVDLGLKVGAEIDTDDINSLKLESEFGKYYQRALEFCLIRPRSQREVEDYLYKKTLSRFDKSGNKKAGMSVSHRKPIIDRLSERGYIDDVKFARFWVENRFIKKGLSMKRLSFELQKKGVDRSIVEGVLMETSRSDEGEIKKIIQKKLNKYDEKQMMAYLARQGFNYDEIKRALANGD